MMKITLTPDELSKAIVMQAVFILNQMTGFDLTPLQIKKLKEGIQKDIESGKHKDSIEYYDSMMYKINN